MRKANVILLTRSLLLFIVLLGVSSYLFYLPYKVVRKSTIDSLNAKQLVNNILSGIIGYREILLSQVPGGAL
jgi:hypothetical protein